MRHIIIAFLVLTIPAYSFAGINLPPISIAEEDGSPIVYSPYKIKVSNNTLTDGGDGTASLSTSSSSYNSTNATIDARLAFNETVTGLDYNSTTGILSQTSGYLIPSTTNQTQWQNGATAYGWGDHATFGYANETNFTTHTGNDTIHVTEANKTSWDGKLGPTSNLNASLINAGTVGTTYLPTQTAASAGIVNASTGQDSKVWKTDASGNPDWRDDASGGGGSSGSGYIKISPQSAKVVGGFITTPARIDGGDNNWRLLFANNTSQQAVWQWIMPDDYNSSVTPVLQGSFSMETATTGYIWINASVMAVKSDNGDVNVTSFDTSNDLNVTVAATAGNITIFSISLANNDSLASNDTVFLKLSRGDNGTSGAVEDMEFLGGNFKYYK